MNRVRHPVDRRPKATTQPISHHRGSHLAVDRVGHIHSGVTRYITHSQRAATTPRVGTGELGELASGANPTRHQYLDRQLVAALVTAGLENGASGSGTHTRAKAVRLGSLSLIGLVSALH